ncbi:FAD-dependent monooxygenase [Cyanobacteria bacterium FACHB-471]|nr:FAD-dependent monooxygenase [Cyanobacteria bacterium FACHB-471]
MIKPLNTAIIGGGIGGLATAIALLKHGFDVKVYERAETLRSVGAGLTLTPNGLNSLEVIHPGIVEVLKQSGSQLDTLTLKRSTGETIASNPITVVQQYGQPMLNIRWSRLQEILASALPTDIIHFGHRCVGFEQLDNSVTLFFSGGKTVETDLLIGADGINSIVRQNLIGDGSPNYAGRVSWRAILQFEHEQLAPNTSTLLTSADGKNFLLVDVGEGQTFWSASALSADDFVHQRATASKTRVLERFADWAELVGEIIKATPADYIVERPICDRPPLQHWSNGRVVLLGDAAHPVVPSLGQGANLAFEDACELAACLSAALNIETALKSYENSRLPRTEVVYNRSSIQGYRSYQRDSETTLNEMMESSQMNQNEFETWLYSYHPGVRACIS